MSKAYDKVMAGLGDAQGYLNGKRDGFVVHEIEVPEPDIVAIRGKTGLSQLAFAKSIGVPLGTLKNWEQGRRRPEGGGTCASCVDRKTSVDCSGRTRPLRRTQYGFGQDLEHCSTADSLMSAHTKQPPARLAI